MGPGFFYHGAGSIYAGNREFGMQLWETEKKSLELLAYLYAGALAGMLVGLIIWPVAYIALYAWFFGFYAFFAAFLGMWYVDMITAPLYCMTHRAEYSPENGFISGFEYSKNGSRAVPVCGVNTYFSLKQENYAGQWPSSPYTFTENTGDVLSLKCPTKGLAYMRVYDKVNTVVGLDAGIEDQGPFEASSGPGYTTAEYRRVVLTNLNAVLRMNRGVNLGIVTGFFGLGAGVSNYSYQHYSRAQVDGVHLMYDHGRYEGNIAYGILSLDINLVTFGCFSFDAGTKMLAGGDCSGSNTNFSLTYWWKNKNSAEK